MTAARQKRKRCGVLCAACAVFVLGLTADVKVTRAALTERIVADWYSGLAIGGYDPVAYFTDHKQVMGSADLELRYDGVTWRFRNIGNREAFASQPAVYMPQFGGYDPLGVARGAAVAGKANVWLIVGGRLYLFYDQAWSAKFAADSVRLSAEAQRKWPGVEIMLSP